MGRDKMVRRLLISFACIFYGNIAYADVTVLSNNELDEVAIATQSVQQIKPFLPKYDSNGQVGGVTGTLTGSNVPLAGNVATPTVSPTVSSVNGGLTLQVPVSSLPNLILNLPSNNIPQNAGH
jgi:hypothetical protein